MILYGIEKLSLVDYDGHVASTVFTGGCNFKCPFCHNGPLVNEVESLNTLTEEYVLNYFKDRKNILDGVCITGGEPTLHNDLPDFIKKIKEIGLKVKLDTNGTNPKMIKSLIDSKIVDYFAMDIKNDKENYSKIIGFDKYDTVCVEKTVDLFITSGVDFEFRTTLIKEFHDITNIENICKWINGTKKYFLQKFKEVDTCLTHGLSAVNEDKAKEMLSIAQKYISESKLRGY